MIEQNEYDEFLDFSIECVSCGNKHPTEACENCGALLCGDCCDLGSGFCDTCDLTDLWRYNDE